MNAKGRFLLLLFLHKGALFGAPQEPLAMQEMRLALENVGQRLHAQNTELSLFQERLLNLENHLNSFRQELKTAVSEKNAEKRILTLEKAHETLIADFKILKSHLNETNSAVTLCQVQLNKIDKQLTSDIQALKTSLNTMLTLLQTSTGDHKTYIVQSGDSLGQIALHHKTDIKTLKKINGLSSDVIFSGQKLLLP